MKSFEAKKDAQEPKGGNAMNRMKKVLAGVLGIGMLALGLTVKAYAYDDLISADNTAQITITIHPNINRSVTITTDSVNMDLGAVSLTGEFVSTQTVSPAVVTVGGTYGNTDLLLSANISGGWTFDATSTSIDTDRLATWVTFSNTSVNTAPSQDTAYFNGTVDSANGDLVAVDAVNYAPVRVGNNTADINGRFENNTAAGSMNGIGIGVQRNMWLFFRMPSATTYPNDQKITFVLTVEQGS
jgi:hypothetical protein